MTEPDADAVIKSLPITLATLVEGANGQTIGVAGGRR